MNQRQFAEATELRAKITEGRADIKFWKGEDSTDGLYDVRPNIDSGDREYLTPKEIASIKLGAVRRLEKQISGWEEKFDKL